MLIFIREKRVKPRCTLRHNKITTNKLKKKSIYMWLIAFNFFFSMLDIEI